MFDILCLLGDRTRANVRIRFRFKLRYVIFVVDLNNQHIIGVV